MKEFTELFKQSKENYLAKFEDQERAGFARYYDIETAWMNSALVSETKLRSCSPISVRKCLANVVTAGLTLSPVMKFCYLIPRRINGQMEATLEISYMGLIKMMTDSGAVKKMEAHIIYRNDEYEIERGDNPKFIHRPVLENRGEMIAVYSEAHLLIGDTIQREILTKDDILEIKKKSQATSGPWIDFEAEMWRKSSIKRLFKYLPKTKISDELIAALAIEHQADTSLITADDIAPAIAAEIFQDTEAEVLENEPAPAIEPKEAPAPKPEAKKKAGRPKKEKEAPAVEVKAEPIIETITEPIAEAPKKAETSAPGNELMTISYKETKSIQEAPQGSKINGSSLSDLMTQLT